jgi:ABC-type branched-subunit amino acid transport system substrate-binding protein
MPSVGVRVRRTWRRLSERGKLLQVIALVAVIAVVGGALVGVLALSGGGSSSQGFGSGPTLSADKIPASTAGVSSNAVTIVFPVINLASAGQSVGLQGLSDEKDQDSIKAMVDAVNATTGGIHGRKINARIVNFNPLQPSEMRALCKDWTTSGNVFAVVDTGKWYDDNQLCITQEGHTPLISSWTTVSDWTQRGSPYLWWTGPDQSDVLRNLVPWSIDHGLLSPGTKFAVIAGDRASDRLAVQKYLLPALAAKGLHPTINDTITANVSDPATAESQARSVVDRLKSSGVQTVIPLLPVNSFFPYLAAAHAQSYAPKLVLSDYENTVTDALGLAEFQYPKELSGQIGPTVYTLGSEDDDRPSGLALPGPGYTPQAKACWQTSVKFYKHQPHPYIEAQGPTMRWCDAMTLLSKALDLAGRNLNRRTFVQALGKVQNLPTAVTPALTFSPTRYAGPVEYRTVRPVKNPSTTDPATNICPPCRPVPNACGTNHDLPFHGSCWQIVEDFKPFASG